MNRLTITIVFVFNFLVSCSTLPPADIVATPLAKHSYVLRGQGSPSIILEAGWGNGRESWTPVYNALSEITQVLAYDRAGYGSSESDNTERDGAVIVQELRALIETLELSAPYVLVGHSLGGSYMELYARTYPDDIAGVVLVDSRHADFSRQCFLEGLKICGPPKSLVARMPVDLQREVKGLNQTNELILNSGGFPNVPLGVLTGANNRQVGADFRKIWLDTQRDLASMSTQSFHKVCNNCGHFIHHDNPDLLVNTVEDIINQARTQAVQADNN